MHASTTRRQHDLLVFIKAYLAEHDGVGPSYAEMMVALGLKSKSGITRLVDGLVERGLLEHSRRLSRSFRVVEQGEDRLMSRARLGAWQEGYAAALRDHGLPAVTQSRARPPGAAKPGQKRASAPAGSFSSPLTCE